MSVTNRFCLQTHVKEKTLYTQSTHCPFLKQVFLHTFNVVYTFCDEQRQLF